MMQDHIYDLIIVGSGGAGLTAAITAKQKGLDVVVVSKTLPTHSQTSQAQGGINCAVDQEDIKAHIDDTLKSSRGLGDIDVISLMCNEAPSVIKWLDEIGVPFSRTVNGNIAQRSLGGASSPRACYSSDYTGLKILHTLYDRSIKDGIEFINEHMLLNLIVEDEVIKGITVLDINTSEVKSILAKNVILATGGYGAIYDGHTTNSIASTGDGVAAAIRADVNVSGLEFVQFHPTSMLGSSVLISESARGEGGYLVDQEGARFVDELSPRDVVARAIYTKILNGDKIYLDLRHLGLEKIMEAMPQERDLALKFSGIKIEDELLPITPAAHYSMGGISTDINCRTNISNLYAIGECANINVHGANRLGGNSLLEIITFGKVAVNSISNDNIEYIAPKEPHILDSDRAKIDTILSSDVESNFYDIKKSLSNVMFKDVGLFRDQSGLDEAHDIVINIGGQYKRSGIKDKSRVFNTSLVEYLQLGNSIELSLKVIDAAQKRKESLGAHFRSDDES